MAVCTAPTAGASPLQAAHNQQPGRPLLGVSRPRSPVQAASRTSPRPDSLPLRQRPAARTAPVQICACRSLHGRPISSRAPLCAAAPTADQQRLPTLTAAPCVYSLPHSSPMASPNPRQHLDPAGSPYVSVSLSLPL